MVLAETSSEAASKSNWTTVCAFFYFHIHLWRVITLQRACQTIPNPSCAEPIYCGLCRCYVFINQNYEIRLSPLVFSSLSGVTPQCGAQGLRAVSEGTNCQGYDSVNDWCGARLFLSACQVAGMFNVLIIGCSVVYISLSAPLSHLNCQSTSKACRSFVFFPTSWMFSLSWVLVICYDLRASWQTSLL